MPRVAAAAGFTITLLMLLSHPLESWAQKPATAIYDVDMAGRNPYRCFRYYTIPAGTTVAIMPCDAAPVGFRLVIEYVSIKAVVSPGVQMWATIGVGDEGTVPVNSIHFIPSRVLATSFEDWLIVSQAVRFYVGSGEVPSVRSNVTQPDPAARAYEITLHGSLIPVR